MKHEDHFFKNRIKRENHDGWQRPDSHLDHAAGEYEPFLSTANLFLRTAPNVTPAIDDCEPLETIYRLKIIPWQQPTENHTCFLQSKRP